MNSRYEKNIFSCPVNGDDILFDSEKKLFISTSGKTYQLIDGLPDFFVQDNHQVTIKQEKFYEKITFPNYDGVENISDLQRKAKRSYFISKLFSDIPSGYDVLEVGCGTGQVTNFLGLNKSLTVTGVDMSHSSLIKALEFKNRNNIKNVEFVRMNIFYPCFKKKFDLVFCSGVLHHTKNPYLGFEKILELLKDDGIIIIGLYNRFMRLRTHFFQIFKHSNYLKKKGFFDKSIKDLNDKKKIKTWIEDQYYNPHETSHSFDELLSWFKKNNIEFLNSFPNNDADLERNLFEKKDPGDMIDRLFIQFLNIFSNQEGGLFCFVGKKKVNQIS